MDITYKQHLAQCLEAVRGGLIVSCQALEDEPLHGTIHMEAMARAALMGGAVGLRANGPEDIAAMRKLTDKPIIGIYKHWDGDGKIFITPDFESAKAVVQAGADIVALDCTTYHWPDDQALQSLIDRIHRELDAAVMADCSNYEEILRAERLGADIAATTLVPGPEPDFALLQKVVESVEIPVIAEGHYWEPGQVVRAVQLGAHAVVVGSAITRPQLITARFTAALKQL